MSFQKIPRQLQEEIIIFTWELKRFRYEEVTSLNICKQTICDFEKPDIVSFSEN